MSIGLIFAGVSMLVIGASILITTIVKCLCRMCRTMPKDKDVVNKSEQNTVLPPKKNRRKIRKATKQPTPKSTNPRRLSFYRMSTPERRAGDPDFTSNTPSPLSSSDFNPKKSFSDPDTPEEKDYEGDTSDHDPRGSIKTLKI
jgi:hypothetical protein